MSELIEQTFYIDPEMQDGTFDQPSTFDQLTREEQLAAHISIRVGALYNNVGYTVVRATVAQVERFMAANPTGYKEMQDEVAAAIDNREAYRAEQTGQLHPAVLEPKRAA